MESLFQFAKNQVERSEWYHNIELVEGLVTPGRKNANASIVRSILDRVDVNGVDCVDIGTVDAFYGVLLSRRKAKSVICTDRANRSQQVSLVKSYTGGRFSYYPGLSIIDMRRILEKVLGGPAGFINFAGVLYHMMDPFGGLAMMRGLVHKGGVVLVDTPAVLDGQANEMILTPDDFYSETTFFTPTLRCLQSMLEFVGLMPIDCAYYPIKRKIDDKNLVRIAIACRAINPPIFEKDLKPSQKSVIRTNLLESIYYPSVFKPAGGLLEMRPENRKTHYDGDNGRIDLYNTCQSKGPTPYSNANNVLRLSDR
jgi:hypothetical protein